LRIENALVTGASGFLGGHLVRTLLAQGTGVHAVSRRSEALLPVGSTPATCDLADGAAVDRLIAERRPAVVFHLASLVDGRRDLDLVRPAFEANLSAAVNLLVAASRAGCRRVVLAGSMEEADLAAGEAPSSPYAAAKSAATLYARLFHALYATPIVTARIHMAYGPGQTDPTKLVPYAIREALAGRAPKISSGARAVDWIYAEDVAAGLVALATAPGIEGESLDLGSGELVTVREVAERICGELGAPPPEVGARPDRPLERLRRADVARTRERAGWSPRVGLDDGLRRTIDAMRGETAVRG
jgi:nucleoside-diphosphate-sugar epimerase